MTFSELHQLQPEHLLKFITQLQEQLIQQKELIETLEAEIRRLKNLPAKPDIKPNKKPSDDEGSENPEGKDLAPTDSGKPDSDASQKRKFEKPNERTRKQRKQPRHHRLKNLYPLQPLMFRKDQPRTEPPPSMCRN